MERIDISTHNGTHLDAPWHFASTMDGGKRAITIDEVPLDWCFQPGVKLDFRRFADGYVATAADVEAELKRIGHTARSRSRSSLVNTSAGVRYGEPDYVPTGCGMGREATLYLTSRGVRITGTDAWSLGRPVRPHGQEVRRDQERAADLGRPQGRAARSATATSRSCTTWRRCRRSGFMVACFPVKIKAASAGWTRAVAIIEE